MNDVVAPVVEVASDVVDDVVAPVTDLVSEVVPDLADAPDALGGLLAQTGDIVSDLELPLGNVPLLGHASSDASDGGDYAGLTLAIQAGLDDEPGPDAGIGAGASSNGINLDLSNSAADSGDDDDGNVQVSISIGGTGLHLSLFGNHGLF